VYSHQVPFTTSWLGNKTLIGSQLWQAAGVRGTVPEGVWRSHLITSTMTLIQYTSWRELLHQLIHSKLLLGVSVDTILHSWLDAISKPTVADIHDRIIMPLKWLQRDTELTAHPMLALAVLMYHIDEVYSEGSSPQLAREKLWDTLKCKKRSGNASVLALFCETEDCYLCKEGLADTELLRDEKHQSALFDSMKLRLMSDDDDFGPRLVAKLCEVYEPGRERRYRSSGGDSNDDCLKNVVSWHVAALFRRLKEEAGEETARKSERGRSLRQNEPPRYRDGRPHDESRGRGYRDTYQPRSTTPTQGTLPDRASRHDRYTKDYSRDPSRMAPIVAAAPYVGPERTRDRSPSPAPSNSRWSPSGNPMRGRNGGFEAPPPKDYQPRVATPRGREFPPPDGHTWDPRGAKPVGEIDFDLCDDLLSQGRVKEISTLRPSTPYTAKDNPPTPVQGRVHFDKVSRLWAADACAYCANTPRRPKDVNPEFDWKYGSSEGADHNPRSCKAARLKAAIICPECLVVRQWQPSQRVAS